MAVDAAATYIYSITNATSPCYNLTYTHCSPFCQTQLKPLWRAWDALDLADYTGLFPLLPDPDDACNNFKKCNLDVRYVPTCDPDALEYNFVPDVIHYVAFVSQWISIPAALSICIFALTHLDMLKKSPALRMPLYVGLADISFTFSHFLDHLIILITGKYPPGGHGGACAFFAWYLQMFSLSTCMNVLSISAYCLYSIFMLRSPNVGKYDWKLLAWGFGIPFIVSLLPFATDSYGHDAAWCWISHDQPKAALGYITIPFLFFLVANIVILLIILWKIKGREGIRKTLRRSLLFVVIYIFVFTPLIILSIEIYLGIPFSFETVLFVVFTINLGGFLNSFAYAWNIWGRSKARQSSKSSHPDSTRASKMRTQLPSAGEDEPLGPSNTLKNISGFRDSEIGSQRMSRTTPALELESPRGVEALESPSKNTTHFSETETA